MFENIVSFFKFGKKEQKEVNSKDTAKETSLSTNAR